MNRLQSQKTTKASFDILGDLLAAINFLKQTGRLHQFSDIRERLDIPVRRLRDILNNRCKGYVVKQGSYYKYSRSENAFAVPEIELPPAPEPIPIKARVSKPKADLLEVLARKEKAKMRSQLPTLRKAEFARIRRTLPNISIERATLMAYQRHPDI